MDAKNLNSRPYLCVMDPPLSHLSSLFEYLFSTKVSWFPHENGDFPCLFVSSFGPSKLPGTWDLWPQVLSMTQGCPSSLEPFAGSLCLMTFTGLIGQCDFWSLVSKETSRGPVRATATLQCQDVGHNQRTVALVCWNECGNSEEVWRNVYSSAIFQWHPNGIFIIVYKNLSAQRIGN